MLLLAALAAHVAAQAASNGFRKYEPGPDFYDFDWRDASGNIRHLSDFLEILRKHRQFLKSGYEKGELAYLSGADLTNAWLSRMDLRGVSFGFANLTRANLFSANLADADLFRTNLSGAGLTDANLTDAWVGEANFDGTIFEPPSLPTLRGISAAQNLERLTYDNNPASLAELRKQFKDGGLREQERKITYALKRREAELSWARATSKKDALGNPMGGGTRTILWSADSIALNRESREKTRIKLERPLHSLPAVARAC